jgi:hypothetical protein
MFNNTSFANVGDLTGIVGSTTPGSVYVALSTSASVANDADAGTECAYTGYARVAVARSGVGWTVAANEATNAAAVTFGECTVGSETVRYAEIYTAGSGGTRLYWTQLDADIAVSAGHIPTFAIGALKFTED